MQVVFVRHAQSGNNVIQDRGATRADFEKLRSHDAELSELGYKQAEELGQGIERALTKRLGPRAREAMKKSGQANRPPRVHVAISPMKRTILTSLPMLKNLNEMQARAKISITELEVVPFIFEVGGCYNEVDGKFVGRPGMNKEQVSAFLPNASVPDEMLNGWWSHPSRESEEQYEARVVKTTEWIKKMACAGTCDVLLVVTHQDFACTCMRRLTKVQGINWLYNTSLSSMTLLPIGSSEVDPEAVQANSDGDMREVHHCSVIIDWINSIDHLSIDNVA